MDSIDNTPESPLVERPCPGAPHSFPGHEKPLPDHVHPDMMEENLNGRHKRPSCIGGPLSWFQELFRILEIREIGVAPHINPCRRSQKLNFGIACQAADESGPKECSGGGGGNTAWTCLVHLLEARSVAMPYDLTEGSIFAVRSAYADLLEAIRSTGGSEEEVREKCAEAERFVMSLLGHIVAKDLTLAPEEASLLGELLDCGRPVGDCLAYAATCSAEWKDPQMLPQFFKTAAALPDHEIARRMLRAIQLIGNNAAAVDGKVMRAENEYVRRCVARLEGHLQ
jgi:hypothetical protein